MKKVLSAAVISGLILSASYCNPFEPEPDQSIALDVSKVDVPSSVTAGSAFDVVLTVTLGGCLSFDRIDVVRSATAANFTVWGRDASKGRKGVMCPENLVLEPHTYRVQPPFSGPFTVWVNRGRLAPLIGTVQVQ
ncbi:MAG: hypothetical protein ACREMS_11515 [Gemmatimonadaceae bacterium]